MSVRAVQEVRLLGVVVAAMAVLALGRMPNLSSIDEPRLALTSPAGSKVNSLSLPRTTTKFERININIATANELESLPRIGPALAARIIEYRSKHGQFASVEALLKVSGIGAKTLETLRPLVRVSTLKDQKESSPAPPK